MTERGCTTGTVYVVETQTGYIKTNVSLERKGNSFTPYEDKYEDDQSTLLAGPTYLALLSTGRYIPDTMIDTESGIYKDVRDHNWHRGGYGVLTLEQALGYHSQVAFAKASESAFGSNKSGLEEKNSDYLGGYTNHVKGVLSFYNAIANGGRMVMLQETEDDVVVMNEQIEEPQYVKALQQGLTHAVSQGVFKRAGRKYTDVAACGRTFQKDKKNRRMELCGYFPADNPMYTIMVVLEKEGLPASAGMMCGQVMGRTIDILVDSYDLRPVVARNGFSDSVEDLDVVVADTVVVQ